MKKLKWTILFQKLRMLYSFLYYHVNIINAKISIYFKLKTTSTKIKH